YAIDIIGEAGKSSGTRPSFKSDGHARWLKEVFDALEIHEAAVCGASLGGTIAQQFALVFPQHVISLILLAPPSLFKIQPSFLFQAILANIFSTDFFAIRFLKYISARGNKFSKKEIQAFVIQIQAYRPNINKIPIISDHDLAQLPHKTLVLLGQDEVLYNPETVVSRIRSVAPFITIAIIPGAKHMISLDQPDLVNDTIIQFLNKE
ncbi:MAG: alpha/beta hydrolase, partial [Gammaproteobacteria bacterium]|nr:alpha/beta hydrolase [Gammaproteobacteria bacterium]